jgi:thymidylate synthase (FAD)
MDKVKLIWITPDAENLITYIARVSNPKNQQKQLETESPEQMNVRLLNYLLEHKHFSPFEMASACFEINTTRAISAQILRHRSFSFQEFSQRYAEVNELATDELPEIRYKGTTNRQSSLLWEDTDIDAYTHDTNELIAKTSLSASHQAYKNLLENGVAPESARMVLPMSSPTRIYMSGTIRSWIHYLQIRTDCSHVQKEHYEIAQQIEEILKEQLPLIFNE